MAVCVMAGGQLPFLRGCGSSWEGCWELSLWWVHLCIAFCGHTWGLWISAYHSDLCVCSKGWKAGGPVACWLCLPAEGQSQLSAWWLLSPLSGTGR